MATTEYSREECLNAYPQVTRKCVRVTKDDGQRINFIDGIGHVEDEFLVIREEAEGSDGRLFNVIKRLPMDSIASWEQRDDYVPQGWRYSGS